ncbi:MAG: type II toxin-antitoxin system Phd/YefM family antitoxin [Rhodobiaceae bacterium]|nr:type II toxin-antitoxin system Phd/YefM family antitoxin [Rhodobiaceae bacterium]
MTEQTNEEQNSSNTNDGRRQLEFEKDRYKEVLLKHFSINSREARNSFARLLDTARVRQERVIITAHGEPTAAVVPMKDVERLDINDEWFDVCVDYKKHNYSPNQVQEFSEWFDLVTELKSRNRSPRDVKKLIDENEALQTGGDDGRPSD